MSRAGSWSTSTSPWIHRKWHAQVHISCGVELHLAIACILTVSDTFGGRGVPAGAGVGKGKRRQRANTQEAVNCILTL